MNPISKVNQISLRTEPLAQKLDRRDISFAERLASAVGKVNDQQSVADTATEKVVKGEMGIHEGLMAVSRADLSLRLLIQVRGKVMDAYNEIMRMQF
ncbi:MAG: flagellar hook-basal body complex protein FliE [Pseudomonadota bacterium]